MKLYKVTFLLLFVFQIGCISSSSNQKELPEPETTQNQPPPTPTVPVSKIITEKKTEQPSSLPQKTQIPQNKIQPFNQYEALTDISLYFTPPEFPIIKMGKIYHITHDFDRDGKQEVIVPGIETENPEDAEFQNISDFSKLYNKEKKATKFNLYIFKEKQGRYELEDKIDLGYHYVLKSFLKLYVHIKEREPIIIATTFQTREGDRHSWIIYPSLSLVPQSILTFENTIHKQVIVEDIDNDGMLDVVIKEKHAEEMKGVETYLLWKKWTGHSYVEHSYTNVVRNLNLFLKTLREKVLQGDHTALFEYAIDPEILGQEKEAAPREILQKYLGIRTFGEEEDNLLDEIRDITFPEILDDPFYLNDDQGSYFPITFRVIYDENISLVSEAYIHMYKNPFGERQFSFHTSLKAEND